MKKEARGWKRGGRMERRRTRAGRRLGLGAGGFLEAFSLPGIRGSIVLRSRLVALLLRYHSTARRGACQRRHETFQMARQARLVRRWELHRLGHGTRRDG